MEYLYKHITMAKTKMRDNTKCDKDVELDTLLLCWWEYKLVTFL